MKVFDQKSCRICLCANSAFVNIFGSFHERSIEQIVLEVCDVVLSRDKAIPQSICEFCMSRLLLAESIRNLCRKNEKFLNELSETDLLDDPVESFTQDETIESIVNENNDNQCESLEEFIEETLEESHSINVDHDDEDEWNQLIQLNEKSKNLKMKEKAGFFCTHCFAEFNTRAKCIYHEKVKHQPKELFQDEIRKFICDRCGMKFKTKSHLINHLNVIHLKIKRYQCNICGFAMYSKTQHTTHLKSHSNVRDFKCNSCGKEFGRKESLQVHQRTHTNERRYICKYCDRSYRAHTDLKRHIFTHTQVQPYLCQICHHGFFLKRQLLEHVNVKHSGVDTSFWLTGKTVHNF